MLSSIRDLQDHCTSCPQVRPDGLGRFRVGARTGRQSRENYLAMYLRVRSSSNLPSVVKLLARASALPAYSLMVQLAGMTVSDDFRLIVGAGI